MLKELDHFYHNQEEETRECLLTLRGIILGMDEKMETTWKYSSPFFLYKGKVFCYLWIDPKRNEPYIGIIQGNQLNFKILEKGTRKQIRILRVKQNEDIPLDVIQQVLKAAMDLY